MNGAVLWLPFLLLRFGLLGLLNKNALRRAAHFAPMAGGARAAYYVYQLSNLAFFVALPFLRVRPVPRGWFFAGLAVFTAGTVLLVLSVVHFAAPSAGGVNCKGLYRFSRNPMYVAYFFYFAGCALLTHSLLLLGILLVFQISAHWVILAEERWCAETFGEAYTRYTQQVRRYF